MENIKNYENLANEVVATAYKDYVNILSTLKRRPDNYELIMLKKGLEDFFSGSKIHIFTKVDGKYLMRLAKNEAGYGLIK